MWSPRALLLACLAFTCLSGHGLCLPNGLALTPSMGYNTWNRFACNISEALVRETAEAMERLGLVQAGYTFLNLDDCWHARTRTAEGWLRADPAKFPAGLRELGDWLRGKGLRFGIYSDSGLLTCQGYPGSGGHEAADADTFASWGVDYLKYDNCFAPNSDAAAVVARYTAMRDALNATGRPILYSLCNWGVADPWTWGPGVGNSWRTEQDIADSWDSVLRCLDTGAAGLAKYAGPGGWNDPDMLEVGNGGLSPAMERAHFALWAIAKAPLLIGCDLRSVSQTSLGVLKATEVIAVNQDPLGVAGDVVWKEGPREVWAGPLAGGGRAVVLFNRRKDGPPANMTLDWAWLGYPPGAVATVRDLYARRDLGSFTGSFSADVANTDVAALRLTPAQPDPGYDEWRPWQPQGGGPAPVARQGQAWRGGRLGGQAAASSRRRVQRAAGRGKGRGRGWRKQADRAAFRPPQE